MPDPVPLAAPLPVAEPLPLALPLGVSLPLTGCRSEGDELGDEGDEGDAEPDGLEDGDGDAEGEGAVADGDVAPGFDGFCVSFLQAGRSAKAAPANRVANKPVFFISQSPSRVCFPHLQTRAQSTPGG
jgi:hypothetical protein